MIVGIFAVAGVILVNPVSANTLPARGSLELKADLSVDAILPKTEPAPQIDTGDILVPEEIQPTESVIIPPEIILTTPTPAVTQTQQAETLEAIRRNNIKQKLEALYGEQTETQTLVKTEIPRKESGIRGFLKTIIRLFE